MTGRAPRRAMFPAGAIMGPLHRHSSLKETKDEASSPAGNPLGDPLSTAPGHPERRPAGRPDEGRAEGRAEGVPEGSASPRGAKGAGDLVVARPGGPVPGAVRGPVPGPVRGFKKMRRAQWVRLRRVEE